MKVIEAGHIYDIDSLDGKWKQTIVFVKRNNPPEKYPGNRNAHPGLITQHLLQCCIDHLKYCNNQEYSLWTAFAIHALRLAFWQLEVRNAFRKNRRLEAGVKNIELLSMCATCGHLECQEHSV